jgi:type IV pilus assembly protein PilO
MLDKLNNQSTPVKLVIALVVGAVIVAAAIYTPLEGIAIGSIWDKTKADKATLAAKEAENNQLRQYESKMVDLDRQIAQLKNQMEYQKQIVPDDKNADAFIQLLQEQASAAGINLRRLEAKPIANKEYYSEVPFAIEADGPFYGMVNFFDKLGSQTRIVNVNDLAMKTTTRNAKYPIGPNDSVTIAAVAKTFYSRETSAPAAAAGAGTPVKK